MRKAKTTVAEWILMLLLVLKKKVIYRQPLLYKLVCQLSVGGDVHTPVVVSEAVGQLHVAAEAVRVPADHVPKL